MLAKKDLAIYILTFLVLILVVFVLFQYYSNNDSSQPFEQNEPELISVQVFYANSIKNPEMLDCSLVFPVSRVVTSREKIYEETIKLLLQGPSLDEKTVGYKNMISENAGLNFAKFNNGILVADFNSQLDYAVGGSCWTAAIRSQIENTMKQWPEVKETVISINGKSEYILQP